MKRIVKYMISCALPVIFSGFAQAQMTAVDTVCRGTTVSLTTPSFRGTIQWQSSPDATTWSDIVGATDDTSDVVVNADTYYRGVISENTCDPFFTDTVFFMVHNYYRSQTFNFTGAMQTFAIPADACDSIRIECWGGQGGSGATGGSSTSGGSGGLGGYTVAYFPVIPGSTLNIFVGGQGATPTGGFNGGANGGTTNAGGGGGASDVRFPGTTESDRIIVAGGGGGGGRAGCETSGAGVGGNGGAGGGGNGVNGGDSPTSGGVAGGGGGAIGSAGGSAGIGCGGFLGAPGSAATGGTGGSGGAGQSCCCFSFGSIPGGGGGGGGLLGGGGGGGGSAGTSGCSGNDKGAGGGGAGGSSGSIGFGVSTAQGIWLGNGQVTISY